MEWIILDSTRAIQLCDNGRRTPTLIVNQGTETVLLSTESSISIGLKLMPGMAYRCAAHINLWGKTETGESTLILDRTNGEFYQALPI